MFLTRGFLFEEAGAPTGAGATPAHGAPVAATPPAGEPATENGARKPAQSIMDLVASRKAAQPGAAAAPPATQTPAEAPAEAPSDENAPSDAQEPGTEPKKTLPRVKNTKPTSFEERIRAKAARDAEAAKLSSQQSEAQREIMLLREQLDLTASESARFKKAFADGDYDAALKVMGTNITDFTKAVIEKKTGAKIPAPDPRVTELEQRLKTYEEREAQREAEANARAQEFAQRQQVESDIADLVAEAKSSGFEEIEKSSGVRGFAAQAYRRVQAQLPELQSGALTMADIWAQTFGDYQELFTDMVTSGAFKVPDRGSIPAKPPDQARVKPASTSPSRPRVADETQQRPATSHISPAGVSETVGRVVPKGAEWEADFQRRKEALATRAFRK